MAKKRYTIRLSYPLAHRFDAITQRRPEAKSGLVEDALRAFLEPQAMPGVEEGLLRRLDELNRGVGRVARDMAIATESLALFVRYYLTITPPLPQSEQEPARLLGRERFEVFVTEVGRRLAGDQRLVSEVLESIAANEPDLLATRTYPVPSKPSAASEAAAAAKDEAVVAGDDDHG
jgi:predicted transcriptional regulator